MLHNRLTKFWDLKFIAILQTVYERHDGTTMVHIVKECPRDFHLGYIAKKGSPYRARFNRALQKFFESGNLYNKQSSSLTDEVCKFN